MVASRALCETPQLVLIFDSHGEDAILSNSKSGNQLMDASAFHFTGHSITFFWSLISWYRMTVGF